MCDSRVPGIVMVYRLLSRTRFVDATLKLVYDFNICDMCRLDFPSLLHGPGQGQANKGVVSKPAATVAAASVLRQVAAPVAVTRASPTEFPSLSATTVSVKVAATKGKKQASNKGIVKMHGLSSINYRDTGLVQWYILDSANLMFFAGCGN